ncbi:type VII secretion target [Mesorhizobium japonicum]|uniref:type VII secretion target n=1 Tax=Mesorhizobium japonicum TaxID=2066070 RepID=UPI003B596792
MADHLKVDSAALRELSGQLSKIATDIDGTQNAFVAATFDLGSLPIEAALEDFERTWGVGRKRIHDDIDALGSMLSDSADTYDSTDQQIAHALTKQDESPSGSSGGRRAE